MSWNTFLNRLGREVDWDRHSDQDVSALEQILSEFGRQTDAAAASIAAIAHDPVRFEAYLPHMEYPRPFMDKFVLHIDERGRFRIRVHRFRAGSPRGLGSDAPTIHDHRWNFSTFVLRGGYSETIFDAGPDGPPTPRHAHALVEGSFNSLRPGVLHQTVNDHKSHPCITLFVRGRSMLPTNRVWNCESQRFRILAGREEQLRVQLKAIADFVSGVDNEGGVLPRAYS